MVHPLKGSIQASVAKSLLTLFITLISSYLVAYLSWELFIDGSSFLEHQKLFIDSLIKYLLSDVEYIYYFQYLRESKLNIPVFIYFAGVLVLCFLFSSTLVRKWLSNKENKFLEGIESLSGKNAIKHARKTANQELKRTKSQKGIFIHPEIYIPESIETDNLLVVGKQGSGKSTILKSVVNQILNSNDMSVIYDAKCEYKEEFHSAFIGKIMVIDPTSKNHIPWGISKDVTNESEAQLISECLINKRDGGGDEAFWIDGARVILTGIFVILIETKTDWGWGDLDTLLNSPLEDLEEIFKKYYPKGQKIVKPGCKTSSGLFSVLTVELNWLSLVASAWKTNINSFSVKDWISGKNKYRSIFILGNPLHKGVSVPICLSIFSLVDRHLRALPDSYSRKLWFVLDELADFPKNKALLNLLTMGRSKGSRTAIGVQNLSQIESIYGEKEAETLSSLFSIICILKIGFSENTASKISKNIGTQKVLKTTITLDSNGRQSINYSEEVQFAVEANDMKNLPSSNKKSVAGYLCINGWNSVYRLDWPIFILRVNRSVESITNKQIVDTTKDISIKSPRGSRGRRSHVHS